MKQKMLTHIISDCFVNLLEIYYTANKIEEVKVNEIVVTKKAIKELIKEEILVVC